jgi:hypothetical protein
MRLEEAIHLLAELAKNTEKARAVELSDFLMICLKGIENIEYTFEYSDSGGRAIKSGFIAVGKYPDPQWALEEALIRKYRADKVHLVSFCKGGTWKTTRYQ